MRSRTDYGQVQNGLRFLLLPVVYLKLSINFCSSLFPGHSFS
jgi:hypothetical protein